FGFQGHHRPDQGGPYRAAGCSLHRGTAHHHGGDGRREAEEGDASRHAARRRDGLLILRQISQVRGPDKLRAFFAPRAFGILRLERFSGELVRSDVLIIGAGPTGLVLALWLTKLGIKVRILDKTAEPGTTSRALAVQARTLELYRQLDLADAVVEQGHKVPAV